MARLATLLVMPLAFASAVASSQAAPAAKKHEAHGTIHSTQCDFDDSASPVFPMSLKCPDNEAMTAIDLQQCDAPGLPTPSSYRYNYECLRRAVPKEESDSTNKRAMKALPSADAVPSKAKAEAAPASNAEAAQPPTPPTPPPRWFEEGAAPGWISPNVAIPADALKREFKKHWSFTSTSTKPGLHSIGRDDYTVPLAPFESWQGSIYDATMRFRGTMSFHGELAGGGDGEGGKAGAGGQFIGGGWFGYWDSLVLYPPVGHPFHHAANGTGSETKNGPLSWKFDVDEHIHFVGDNEGALYGFTTASYDKAEERQCAEQACADMWDGKYRGHHEPYGMCGMACAGTSGMATGAIPLQQLSWRRPDLFLKTVKTPFSFTISKGFKSVRTTINVSVSFSYRYKKDPNAVYPPPPPAPPSMPGAGQGAGSHPLAVIMLVLTAPVLLGLFCCCIKCCMAAKVVAPCTTPCVNDPDQKVIQKKAPGDDPEVGVRLEADPNDAKVRHVWSDEPTPTTTSPASALARLKVVGKSHPKAPKGMKNLHEEAEGKQILGHSKSDNATAAGQPYPRMEDDGDDL